MSENIKELDKSLIQTIKESDLKGIAVDSVDALTTGLPVFGALLAFGTSVSNYMFTKKLLKFLVELQDVPVEKRQAMIERLGDSEESQKMGEHLLLMLDRLNDMRKASMMGKGFKAYLEGKISQERLVSLNYALDVLNIQLVDELRLFCKQSAGPRYMPPNRKYRPIGKEPAPSSEAHFAVCGLANLNYEGGSLKFDAPLKPGNLVYVPNELGQLFVAILL